MNQILKYPGGKARIASWIISHFPPHNTYCEPFFGSGAVFFNKAPDKIETINDIDGDVVNFFRVCRDDPESLSRLISLTPSAREQSEWGKGVALPHFRKNARMGRIAVKMRKNRIHNTRRRPYGRQRVRSIFEKEVRKMKLDMVALAKTLLDGSVPYALMRYIFRTQGAQLKRLDYNAAAEALNIDRRTISRTVNALAAKKLLVIQGGMLRISEELIRQAG